MMLPYILDSQTFIDNLKRAAKKEKRAVGVRSHSYYLDRIASVSGFQSWALLHKKIDNFYGFQMEFAKIRQAINTRIAKTLPHAAQDYVIQDLRAYLKSLCIEYSDYYQPHPSRDNLIDVREAILTAYAKVYPELLLQNAINELEKKGPWIEDDEMIVEYDILDSGN